MVDYFSFEILNKDFFKNIKLLVHFLITDQIVYWEQMHTKLLNLLIIILDNVIMN